MRPVAVALRLLYIAVILAATLGDVQGMRDPTHRSFERAFDFSIDATTLADALRNTVLFAGWGLVWVATSGSESLWRTLRSATVSGFVLSVGVESAQLFSLSRHASLRDVVANTVGAFGGGLLFVTLVGMMRPRRRSRLAGRFPVEALALSGWLGGVLIIVGSVLRGAEGIGLAAPAREVAHTSWTYPWRVPLFLAGLPLLGWLALVERGLRRWIAAATTAAGGVGVFATVWFAAGAGAWAPTAGKLAVVCAALAALGLLSGLLGRFGRRVSASRRRAALLFGYASFVLLASTYPFVPEPDWAAIATKLNVANLVPLRSYWATTDAVAALDIVAAFLLFLPAGWLFREGRSTRAFTAIFRGMGLALAVELVRAAGVGQSSDMTDLFVRCAAVTAGAAVLRRLAWEDRRSSARLSRVLASAESGEPSQGRVDDQTGDSGRR